MGTAHPPSNRSAPATGGVAVDEVDVVAARAGPARRVMVVTAAATARKRVIRMRGHSPRTVRTPPPKTANWRHRSADSAHLCRQFGRGGGSGGDDGLRGLDRMGHAELVVLLDDQVVGIDG